LIDGYGERGGGLSLKRLDSVQFVQWMSQITAKYNLAVGLKNAMELLSDVSKNVQFAVNEECVKNNECTKYVDFVHKHNKPVFHIEYPLVNLERKPIDMERKRFCAEYTPSITGKNFQSVIKLKKLNGWVVYCDGKQWKTPTVDRGASRFSGRSNYVVTSNLTELEGAGARNRVVDMSPDPEPNPDPSPEVSTLDSAAIQAEIARQDGFPFPPGKGSDQFISDEELMAYDLDVSSPDSLEHAPETADANQPSEMSRQPSESPFEHPDESR
jgi:hypothetical protein